MQIYEWHFLASTSIVSIMTLVFMNYFLNRQNTLLDFFLAILSTVIQAILSYWLLQQYDVTENRFYFSMSIGFAVNLVLVLLIRRRITWDDFLAILTTFVWEMIFMQVLYVSFLEKILTNI